MKKLLAILLFLLLLCQIGCAAPSPTEPDTTLPETPTSEDNAPGTKIGLITDCGPVDDGGYNAAAWNAVATFSTENNLSCANYQPAGDSTDQRIDAMKAAIAEGCNVLVLPGWPFGAAIYELQNSCPDVTFLGLDIGEAELWDYETDTACINENVCCVTFEESEIGYLVGYAAVAEGYTKLAFASPQSTPDMQRLGYGFLQGANDAAAELTTDVSVKTCYSTWNNYYGDGIASLYQPWSDAGTELLFTTPQTLTAQDQMKVVLHDSFQSDNPGVITFARKDYAAATTMLLECYLSESLQPYCGKVTNLTLADGNYLGIDTDHWGFETFTPERYRTVVQELANGTRTVSNDIANAPNVAISVENFG